MHPIIQILRDYGYRLHDKGDNFSCAALYRGGVSPTSLSVHRRTGEWYDFVARMGGKAEDLAKIVKGEITKFDDWDIDVEIEEKFKPMKRTNDEILNTLVPDWTFFTNRGISDETMKTFEAGFCMAYQMRKRIIFPIRDRDTKNIIGFAGRWFQEATPSKNIGKWKLLAPKKNFIAPAWLNEDIIRKKKRIIIIESYGDMLSLWDAGIKESLCIFGLNISPKQINYLLGLDLEKIIIATNRDEDPTKGQAAALKIETRLLKFFDKSQIEIRLPTEKDIQAMDKKLIIKHYE